MLARLSSNHARRPGAYRAHHRGIEEMTTKLNELLGVLESARDSGLTHGIVFTAAREDVVQTIHEIKTLQQQHGTQAHNIRAILADLQAVAKERDELRDALARKAFEVTVLELTQGALKMEIDRLRDDAVVASNATVTVSRDGKMTITAPLVVLSGKVGAH
ncbi:hypothetical protein [Paraburkholderia phenoliruptrix]|uniref:hypothetical protein n=1 Tax=Paraburkholderia phenoliruptrix TaxID=252970 RepID=UPI0034CDFE19